MLIAMLNAKSAEDQVSPHIAVWLFSRSLRYLHSASPLLQRYTERCLKDSAHHQCPHLPPCHPFTSTMIATTIHPLPRRLTLTQDGRNDVPATVLLAAPDHLPRPRHRHTRRASGDALRVIFRLYTLQMTRILPHCTINPLHHTHHHPASLRARRLDHERQ